MAGPSLSLEVLAWGGRAVPLQVTGLEFDAAYDCRRVVAPVGEAAGEPAAVGPGGACAWDAAVPAGVLAAFDAASVALAEGLRLNGLMDVEVMVGGGRAEGCWRSTPACRARRRRWSTGRAGSTSWNCCSGR